jgi:hypothetical protein
MGQSCREFAPRLRHIYAACLCMHIYRETYIYIYMQSCCEFAPILRHIYLHRYIYIDIYRHIHTHILHSSLFTRTHCLCALKLYCAGGCASQVRSAYACSLLALLKLYCAGGCASQVQPTRTRSRAS